MTESDEWWNSLSDYDKGELCLTGNWYRPQKEPHIICLAASKHYRLRPAMTAKAWIISLVRIGNRADKFVAKGETFWEAERIAREFLNGVKI